MAKTDGRIAAETLGDKLKLTLASCQELSGGNTICNKSEAVSSLPCILHVLLSYSNSTT